jgi:hypothetical protein
MALGVFAAAVGVPWIVAPSTVGAGSLDGIIDVVKVVGPGGPIDGAYVVTVSCTGLGDQQIDLNGPGGLEPASVPDDYQGTCTFTETTTGGGTPSYACDDFGTPGVECETAAGPDPQVMSLDNAGGGQIAQVTVTNSFGAPGGAEPDPAALALDAVPTFTG